MKTVKNVFGWIAYGCVYLIKLPFSILSAFLSAIEFLIAYLNVVILRWIGSEFATYVLHWAARFNSGNADSIADFWDDIAEEEL